MDTIQKTLVKAGRKDLAQKYYEKVAYPTAPGHRRFSPAEMEEEQEPNISKIRRTLVKYLREAKKELRDEVYFDPNEAANTLMNSWR